jgi:hypothetical protein
MRKWQQGQDFWIELLVGILENFSLYFYEFYTIFDEFLNLELISGN